MTREDLIRIVNVFKNDGVDVETGRKLRENEIYDLLDKFDEYVEHPAGSEIIFGPEDYGLPADATAEEIVDLAMNKKE